jgi:hypothetical protein
VSIIDGYLAKLMEDDKVMNQMDPGRVDPLLQM